MTIIDRNNWARKEIYDFFSGISDPFYMVTFRMDVSPLYQYTKAHGLSFYKGMIWACTQAMNHVDAFRISLRGEELVMLDRRSPSFTDLKAGSDEFHIVTMDHMEEIDRFCEEADRLSNAQETFIDPSKESDALIYLSGEDPRFYKRGIDQYPARLSGGLQSPTEINAPRGCAGIRFGRCQLTLTRIPRQFSRARIEYSCLLWIEMTALTNERDLSAPGALNDSIPRLAWGKYVEEGGRKMLGISVEVNHRFIDGIHIGRFAQQLEMQMRNLLI